MRLLLIFGTMVALLGGAQAAEADTFTISGTGDAVQAGPAYGCSSSGAANWACVTLRGAVQYIDANAGTEGGSEIQLGAGAYDLHGGALVIGAPLTISGTGTPGQPGGSTITVTDIPMVGTDVIQIGNTTGTVTLSDVEVTGGLLWLNGPGEPLTDEVGGGIYVSSGATAQLTGDLIDGNQARVTAGPHNGEGGGIATFGTLTVTGTTVEDNGAIGGSGVPTSSTNSQDYGGLGEGGGIAVLGGSTTIDGGSVIAGNAARGGDGSYNAYSCMVSLCAAAGAGAIGGGIAVISGSLTVTGSAISGNQAIGGNGGNSPFTAGGQGGEGNGGGVAAEKASLSVTATTISGNSAVGGDGEGGGTGRADGGQGGGFGGGLWILGNGSAAVSDDTLAQNSATAGKAGSGGTGVASGDNVGAAGGGAYFYNESSPGSPLAIVNSTFTGNTVIDAINPGGTALVAGGGVFLGSGATLASSTLSANTVSGPTGAGGNLSGVDGTVVDAIIAGGVAATDGNCYRYTSEFVSGFTDGGFNLEDSGAGASQCSLSLGSDRLVAAGAAGLDPAGPQSNGGPTQTIALTAASPAVGDGGACTDPTHGKAALTADQRGDARGATCDIGAFQLSGNGAPAGGGGGAPAGGGGGAPAGGGAPGGGGGPSGGGPAPGGGGPGPVVVTSARIIALLAPELAPRGKSATIKAILQAGGAALSLTALEPGAVAIDWYEVPARAHLASGRAHAKPVLVASGAKSFAAAGTYKVKVRLTRAGRHLLAHAKHMNLTARCVFRAGAGAGVKAQRRFALKRGR